MAKPQPLIVAPVGNAFSFGAAAPNGDVPATPEEKVAASALLTLLSSPSLGKTDKNEAPNGWAQPALKRQKSDPSLKRRVLSSYGATNHHQAALLDSSNPTSGPPSDPASSVVAAVTNMSVEEKDVVSVVTRALNGEPVEPAKLEEAEKWLYQSVELVRGKYKGRVAVVVGMTAKKYRVRVDGVEHQLEFYPTMFKNPVSVPNPATGAEEKVKTEPKKGSPKPQNESAAPVAPASATVDGDTQSGSSAGARSVSEDTCPNTANPSRGPSSPAVAAPAQGGASTGLATKTSADLLRLMEETNVEMQKARSMLASFPPSPAGKPPPCLLASSQQTHGGSSLNVGASISGKGEAETAPNRPVVMGQSTHPNQSPQLTAAEGKKVVQEMLTEVQEDKVNVMLANPVKATEVISNAMNETYI